MKFFQKKLLTCTTAGVVIAGLVAWSRGLFYAPSAVEAIMDLCDGFFVAGALLLLYGGLVFTYNGGAMDGLGYTVKIAVNRIKRDYMEGRLTYQEYRERREAKARSPKHFLISGLMLLAVGVFFYFVYKILNSTTG